MATTTKKTIRQWLKEALTPDEYAKAEKYQDADWDTISTGCAFNALGYAFMWMNTIEGPDYWAIISDRLEPADHEN